MNWCKFVSSDSWKHYQNWLKTQQEKALEKKMDKCIRMYYEVY